MAKNKNKRALDQRSALEKARVGLRSLRIPWYEVELAAAEVSKSNPFADGEDLVRLIMSVAVDHWSTGTGR